MRRVATTLAALLLAADVDALVIAPSTYRRRTSTIHSSAAVTELPLEPTDTLDAKQAVWTVCEGLRLNDDPKPDAGVERLYNYLTPMGRVAIAPPPPRSGLQGGVTLEYFLEEGASAALGALIFCSGFSILEEPRISPSGPARGALAYLMIEVGNSPLEDASDANRALRAMVRAPDAFLEEVLTSVREGTELPAAPPEAQIKDRFEVALEQERRPPHQGCWFIKEILPMKKTKWQALNEGGEEFEGED